MSEIIVAASGYFDPIHIGHIECLELAKKLGDKLIVIVNNDKQAVLKKGYEFMPFEERIKIVKSLGCVDEVFACIDEDRSVCKSLETIKPNIFAKGGDRNSGNIPEKEVCDRLGIKIIDGLGMKIQSSSELVKRFREKEEMKKDVVEEIRKFVEEECKKETAHYGITAYNHHFISMVDYSKRLAKKLKADEEIVEIAAWLHDIGSIIIGRENHHITGAEIAEKKLQELGYPEDRIKIVKECILNHRGSQEKSNKRESQEARIIAEADSLSTFDDLAKHFWVSLVEEKKDINLARESVLKKLENKFNQLSPDAKNLIKPKYDAALLLLKEATGFKKL